MLVLLLSTLSILSWEWRQSWQIIKHLQIYSNQRRNKRVLYFYMSFGASSLYELSYEPSKTPGPIPKPVDLGRYTNTGLSTYTHTRTLRTNRFQNPSGKPKNEKESVLILWTTITKNPPTLWHPDNKKHFSNPKADKTTYTCFIIFLMILFKELTDIKNFLHDGIFFSLFGQQPCLMKMTIQQRNLTNHCFLPPLNTKALRFLLQIFFSPQTFHFLLTIHFIDWLQTSFLMHSSIQGFNGIHQCPIPWLLWKTVTDLNFTSD